MLLLKAVTNTEQDTVIGRIVRERRDLRQLVHSLHADLAAMGTAFSTFGNALEMYGSVLPADHPLITLTDRRFSVSGGVHERMGELPQLETVSARLTELQEARRRLEAVERQADGLGI